MKPRFFITTPIYYSNSVPHIGNAYTSIIADVIARIKRLAGYEVKFGTGVDEHSQKIVQKAQEAGISLQDYLDTFAAKHQEVRDALQISYTDFIRTTQDDHKEIVRRVLSHAYQAGDIYQGEYTGYYCIGCEAFKKQSDIVEADGTYEGVPKGTPICPLHPNKPLTLLSETNYFFRLSEYQGFLEQLYADRADFIVPSYRSNEITAFINEGLEDFSISRETNTFGIPLPFDEEQVTYVWYDALFNYVTLCQRDGYRDEDTQIVHVLGKDIARFHAIFWPAMLQSVGYRLPDREVINGFFTVDGQKMSKSLDNVIDPIQTQQAYGRDAIVFYLLYDVVIGRDGDFSRDRFRDVRNSMLVGGRGNLVSRITTLGKKTQLSQVALTTQTKNVFDAEYLSYVQNLGDEKNALMDIVHGGTDATMVRDVLDTYVDTADLQGYARDWYQLVQGANKFIDAHEPWKAIKSDIQQAHDVLGYALYLIKNIAILGAPLLIESIDCIASMTGIDILHQLDTSVSTNIGNNGDSSIHTETLLSSYNFTVSLVPGHVYTKVEK